MLCVTIKGISPHLFVLTTGGKSFSHALCVWVFLPPLNKSLESLDIFFLLEVLNLKVVLYTEKSKYLCELMHL